MDLITLALAKKYTDKKQEEAASTEVIKQAVDEYMAEHPETDPTVPDWAKQPEKPKYTAAEVGALPADTVIPEGVTDEQIKDVVDAYLTENPVSGGGSKWRLIGDVTTTEEVSSVAIDNDTPLNDLLVYCEIPIIATDPGGTIYGWLDVCDGDGAIKKAGVCFPSKPTTTSHRRIIRADCLGCSIQTWTGSIASGGAISAPNLENSLVVRDAFSAGGGLIGFRVEWNLENVLPTGVHIQVWGR